MHKLINRTGHKTINECSFKKIECLRQWNCTSAYITSGFPYVTNCTCCRTQRKIKLLSLSKVISKYQNNHTQNNPSIFKGNKTLLPSLLQCFFQSSYNIPASQWASVRRGKVQGGNQGRKRWMTAASRGPPHKSTHILSEFYWCCGKGPVRHQRKVMVNQDSQELGNSSP